MSISSTWQWPAFKQEEPCTKKEKRKSSDLTEKELMLAFAEHLGDIGDYEIDQKEEKRMFEEMQSIDYFQTYLRAQIARDMQLYFAATDDIQRSIIKGRMARSASFKARLAQRKDNEVVETKMKGLRYA